MENTHPVKRINIISPPNSLAWNMEHLFEQLGTIWRRRRSLKAFMLMLAVKCRPYWENIDPRPWLYRPRAARSRDILTFLRAVLIECWLSFYGRLTFWSWEKKRKLEEKERECFTCVPTILLRKLSHKTTRKLCGIMRDSTRSNS